MDIREYLIDPDKLEEIIKFNYHKNGREIKRNHYKVNDGVPVEDGYAIYKYDGNNHIIEIESHNKASRDVSAYISANIITNDKYGNPLEVKKIFYDQNHKSPSPPSIEFYKYEYDKKGNWIKKTQTWSEYELLIQEYDRTIEYY